MKVKRNTLLLIACLVWSAAGFNILRIGVLAYPAYLSVWNFLLPALVFTVFQIFIFGRLVKKAHHPYRRLRGGASLLYEVLRRKVLPHHGGDDVRRREELLENCGVLPENVLY